ncbi:hypothetical protein RN001_014688 [Aquatica leii]|uniref:UDP-glycosyltransferase n=1 Tax=Aquatica leii TaxID=1421715 RepID=A0AAN7PNQ4_9COLE|nr:hypothetical protein RN001_014688 [Aquatica leii]
MSQNTLAVVLLLVFKFSAGARILGVVAVPSYSHQVTFRPIWKELSLRGHQVVSITTDPINDPSLANLTEIDIHSAYDIWNENIAEITTSNAIKSFFLGNRMFTNVEEHILSHDSVQNLIKNETEYFDVVIIEYGALSMLAFAERFKAPLITASSLDAIIDVHHLMGNPLHFMLYPYYMLPVHYDLIIIDRIIVTVYNVFNKFMKLHTDAVQNDQIKKFFGRKYPSVTELMQNISLVLSNSDPIFHKIKPLLPTIVEFGGGTHRVLPKPLPEELKKLLDLAKHGFIYFSLGSNVKSKHLSKDTRDLIMETFAELPYTVLWKFEDDNLPNKASNVITSKWLPQQDILMVVLLLALKFSAGARILGVVAVPSYSHQVAFRPIWKELSLRGHQVVTITTDPMNDSSLVNLTEIDIQSAYDIWNRNLSEVTNANALKSFFLMIEIFSDIEEHILSHDGVQNLIKNETEFFDVVIVEYGALTTLAFAERFKAPLIVASSLDAFIDIHHLMGNPIHFMLYPFCLLPVHYDLTFVDRIIVTISNGITKFIKLHVDVVQNSQIKKYFGRNYPLVTELEQNISLMLSNSDPIFHKIKPLLPTIVEFGGGTHRVLPKPLPEELMKLLDLAKHGFIYFSLGSNVKSKHLSKDTRDLIMETFAELPYTVLWKFEDDNLPNKASNVITSKWLPQQDILMVVLLLVFKFSDGARILGVVPIPSYSHQVTFRPIWKELSFRGHQVVTITTDPIKDPNLTNLTEIDIKSTYDIWNKDVVKITNSNAIKSFVILLDKFYEIEEHILSHDGVQNLIKNETEHFDVVIVEYGALTTLAFAERFKASLIVASSLDAFIDIHHLMGNPIHSMLYPLCILPVHYELTFVDRIIVTIYSVLNKFIKLHIDSVRNSQIKKYFGRDYPLVTELEQNISLMLSNSDPIFHKIKPLLPTIVEFGGGSHRVPPKPLPEELKKLLDLAKHGFVYFSLGSNVRSKHLPKHTRDVIMKTFAELPYTVLWKFEDDSLPNKPSNVITSKWLPQQDVLSVVPAPSYSHQVAFQPIWKELSLRGHQVVTITTDPIHDPNLVNLTEIDLKSAYDIWNNNIVDITTTNALTSFFAIMDTIHNVGEHILAHRDVQYLIKNETEHFDVVIVEYNLLSMFAFAKRFNAPLVVGSSLDGFIDLHYLMGNPIHFMLYPICILPVHYNLSLSDRILVVMYNLFFKFTLVAYFYKQNDHVKSFFGEEYPPITEFMQNISLVLSNSDPIFHKVKPLLPNIVEFGGGVVPSTCLSHQVVFQAIWKELSLRGHQVVTITTDTIKDPNLVNLTEIDLKSAYGIWNKHVGDITHSNALKSYLLMMGTFFGIEEHVISHVDVQNLIKNETEYFDAVIVEHGALSMMAFAARFKAPLIAASSFDAFIDMHDLMGNPLHFMLHPFCLLPVHYDLDIIDRIIVVVYNVFEKFLKLQLNTVRNELIKKYFGKDYPSVTELEQSISLVLSNSDPIFHKVKPLLPTIVEYGGGSHRVAPKPLPKDLKKMLDQNGFIYLSFGTNVKSRHLPKRTLEVIMEAFAELPYTVLWKFEADDLPNKPSNVIISKWLPQQDVFIFEMSDSARILGVVPSPSYSHQVVFQPIWKELSLRGHQVVTITTDPIKDPNLVNLTEIDLKSIYDIWNKNLAEITNANTLKSFFLTIGTIFDLEEHTLSHDDVQNLIKNETEYFDVVIVEYSALSMMAFAKRFKAPLIVGNSVDSFIDIHHLMGNPVHSMLYPFCLLPVHYDLVFVDRILVTIYNLVSKVLISQINLVRNKQVKKYFGEEYPSISELEQNISLVLSNSDPIFHKIKPLLPTIVEFGGGTHRVPPKPLQTELKKLLDLAKHGFIYFSLGSNVKSKHLTNHTRDVIKETFAELSYTVLWKFEDDNLPNKPSNVITSKWLPQQDIFNIESLCPKYCFAMDLKTVVVAFVIFSKFSDSARILGVVPTPSYSHQVAFRPIWKELSSRGHQVVTITTDPIKDRNLVNLTEIDLNSAYDVWNENIVNMTTTNALRSLFVMVETILKVSEHILGHRDVQKLIKNETEYFDVVIVEYTFLSILAFAERFKAHLIVGSSVDGFIELHHLMGNPIHFMLHPNCVLPVQYDLLFSDRILVAMYHIFFKIMSMGSILIENDRVKRYFGNDYPSVTEYMQNISLVLSNSDPIFHKVKPMLPTIVEFGGGTHRVAPKPLPEELKKILDSAENGFIYFSLGSNVKSKFLSEHTRGVIMKTFAKLPYTILWKFEDDDLTNKPGNVITSKWFPQQDVFIAFLVVIKFSNGARILGVVPTPSYSHQVAFRPIWKELSLRGHQVVIITTDPIRDRNLINLTEIDVSFAYNIWNKHVVDMTTTNALSSFTLIMTTLFDVTEHILTHHDVQKLVKNETEYFDVVIVEFTVMSMFAFAERFKAPIITVSSLDGFIDLHYLMGNPIHFMLYPISMLPVHYDLSFTDRILVAIYNLFYKSTMITSIATENDIVKRHFGENYQSVLEYMQNISLVLSNSDPIFHKVKPLLPTIIEFGGGTHRVASRPLPEELKKMLDSAEDGFIYFSLGTNVKSKFLDERTRSVIMNTFAELPYTILWKFEDDLLNKPKNVIASKWFPQQDVFKHPNIKLFITQGGLQSIDEALYDYVPMLIMPFFGDQRFNAHRMVAKGCALSIDYETMTKDEFKTAILELIDNPKYKNRIMELAKLAQDQPMSGIEKAVWWIEYVIRHKGTAHLRSPYLDMPAYQYYYLDMIAVFGLAFLILIGIFVGIVKLLLKALSFLFRKKTKPKAE